MGPKTEALQEVNWSELAIEQVFDGEDDGTEALAEARNKDAQLYLAWLKDEGGKEWEDWLEPGDHNRGKSDFETIAHNYEAERISWVRESLTQAVTALNDGTKKTVSKVDASVLPSWLDNGESNVSIYGFALTPPKLVIANDLTGLIQEKSELKLPPRRNYYRGPPGPQSFGGLVVRTTTTVTQMTKLSQAWGFPFNRRRQFPEALVLQAWRTKP